MAVTLEEVIKLADQLSIVDREGLISHLLRKRKNPNDLTMEEFKALLEAAILPGGPGPDYSDRREDWYGDDGR